MWLTIAHPPTEDVVLHWNIVYNQLQHPVFFWLLLQNTDSLITMNRQVLDSKLIAIARECLAIHLVLSTCQALRLEEREHGLPL